MTHNCACRTRLGRYIKPNQTTAHHHSEMTTTRGAFVIVDKLPPANDAEAMFCWVLPATPGMEFVRGVPTELPGDAQPVAPGEHTVPACAQQFHARIVQGTVMTRDHNSGTALIVRDAKPSGASSLEAMSKAIR